MTPAVFLDRDGTMIRDVHYLRRLEDVQWFASTIDAIRLMNQAGFLVFVVTNQSGVGQGAIPAAFVPEVHARMAETLAAGGARVDGWFYCPHHPSAEIERYRANCDCRKPAPGLVRQAQAQHAIDLAKSFVIGDKPIDVALGVAVGARSILVRTGYGEEAVRAHGGRVPGAAFVAADLMEATSWLLGASGHPRGAA